MVSAQWSVNQAHGCLHVPSAKRVARSKNLHLTHTGFLLQKVKSCFLHLGMCSHLGSSALQALVSLSFREPYSCLIAVRMSKLRDEGDFNHQEGQLLEDYKSRREFLSPSASWHISAITTFLSGLFF